ncbi:MAG: phosphoribosylformylglycinamidine synthase [Clostridia bacterium]|nr:phosphoribosylformylglycinamidine synthase [Clostridia bacterium]
MVYRVFVEKKKEFAAEAAGLLSECRNLLGITSLEDVRVINRYDAENIDAALFDYAKKTVFSEPQVDICSDELKVDGAAAFAVEYLPGQFDQRADSAAQCIQIIAQCERPLVRSAKVYVLYGSLSEKELTEIKKYVINPVEAREATMEKPETLVVNYDIPTTVATLDGFTGLDEKGLAAFIKDYGLAMDLGDIKFCQQYFLKEQRDPTITEIRMIDTYWSDHCRHTTFGTIIDNIKFEDPILEKSYERYIETRKALGRTKPVCLMDIATIAVKYLRKNGMLDKLDESEEINACTVKIEVEADGVKEPWLLLFKNETHNHPTEIEPFGGAATCVGGAIRDPLSGRSYVYGAMRVTGAADPRKPISETLPGKLPQRKIVTSAAAGYASYGNQIGLATGIVDEIYHPGYMAKRMEIGAVIAAAPAENVRREVPAPGDIVILLGGSTGRDGIGGATGSSKAHDSHSVENCGAEVQKGNAPEERKLQRMFRNPAASKMIKRCNDFGAGGVSVAIGELAAGLDIDLNAVPKKYEGLDGTELAISESQERMAVVVEAKDEKAFLEIAASENLQAVRVAVVKADPRLTMEWNGKKIVDISREFLDSNGAEKHIEVETPVLDYNNEKEVITFMSGMKGVASDLNCCSKRGLSERFDSTIGAGTVVMPFGGKYQQTPVQAMVQKISMEKKHTDDCSLMAYGYNPLISEKSPYHGAYLAVVESVSKLIASGAQFSDVYLSFQEYFEKLGRDSKRWGKPLAALLGAFDAQMDLGIGAIGGKDSMSGSFEDIHVPPTLVSFAVTTAKTGDIVTPEFKEAGHPVILMQPELNEAGLPEAESLKELYDYVTELVRSGMAVAVYTPGMGGVAEGVMKMCFGNGIGFEFDDSLELEDIFNYAYGSFIVELKADLIPGMVIGYTSEKPEISYGGISIELEQLQGIYEGVLEDVYPCNIKDADVPVENISYKAETWAAPVVRTAKPKVLIPVFPGTNCEFDSAKAMNDAGAESEIFVIRNRSAEDIARSVDDFAERLKTANMIFIPGGFSGGDEPDGSGKFITSFFRSDAVKDQVADFMDSRGGLICGICNGFQALIKLGLVPYGKIIDTDENCPTLSFNDIHRHQSRIVQVRVASNKSPWLRNLNVGDVYNVPISHGEGKFIASEELVRQLISNGQVATQYVDLSGNASADIQFNPNGSTFAIEGITSPDGRVFGKMGHAERWNSGLYQNVPGNYDMGMFRSAVEFFKE